MGLINLKNNIRFENLKKIYKDHRKTSILTICGVILVGGLIVIQSCSRNEGHEQNQNVQNASQSSILTKVNHMDPKKIIPGSDLTSKLTQKERDNSLNYQKGRVWDFAMRGDNFRSKAYVKHYLYDQKTPDVPKSIQKQALDYVPDSAWQRNCDVSIFQGVTSNSDFTPDKYDEFFKNTVIGMSGGTTGFTKSQVLSSLRRMDSNKDHPYGSKSIVSGNLDTDIAYGVWATNQGDKFNYHSDGNATQSDSTSLLVDGLGIGTHALLQKYGKWTSDGYQSDKQLSDVGIPAKKPADLHSVSIIK